MGNRTLFSFLLTSSVEIFNTTHHAADSEIISRAACHFTDPSVEIFPEHLSRLISLSQRKRSDSLPVALFPRSRPIPSLSDALRFCAESRFLADS